MIFIAREGVSGPSPPGSCSTTSSAATVIARLQAATSGGPDYLSMNAHAGHGIGSALSIRVGQWADQYAFLFDQLGLTVSIPRGADMNVETAH